MIQVAPGAAAFCPDRPALRVYTDAPHPPQVDDEAIVTGSKPRGTVATTPHGQCETVRLRKLHSRHYVCHSGGVDYHCPCPSLEQQFQPELDLAARGAAV